MGALFGRLMALFNAADKAKKGRVIAKIRQRTGEDVSEGGLLNWLRKNWAISSVSLLPTVQVFAEEWGLDLFGLLSSESEATNGLFSGVDSEATRAILNRVMSYTATQRANTLGDGEDDEIFGESLDSLNLVVKMKDASDVLHKAQRLIGGPTAFDTLRTALLFDDETINAARMLKL